jgi:hypothetical protein
MDYGYGSLNNKKITIDIKLNVILKFLIKNILQKLVQILFYNQFLKNYLPFAYAENI